MELIWSGRDSDRQTSLSLTGSHDLFRSTGTVLANLGFVKNLNFAHYHVGDSESKIANSNDLKGKL